MALRKITLASALLCFAPFLAARGGSPLDWTELEPALALPENLPPDSALGRRLAEDLSDLDRAAPDWDLMRSIAILYHANEYDFRAKTLYDCLIASCQDPEECARLNYLAAQLVKEKGDSEQARAYLEASVAAYDGYAMALVQLGDAKFKVGELAAAEALFERAKSLDRELASAYVGLARVYERRGETERMVGELESILQFDPGNSPALALLSQVYARLGDEKRAYEISESIGYSSLVPEGDPWFEDVREAIYDPQRLDFLFLDYFVLDRFEEALPYLERMEALDPENPRYSRYRAVMYMGFGYYDKAEEELYEGLAKGGQADVFYPLLVKSMNLRGAKEEAERTAREAVARFGASGELNLGWARLLVERQALDEAMEVLEQGLESDPYFLELHFARARLGMKTGKLAAARESLRMVRQLAPMDAEALVRAALVLMEAGRFDEALPLLQQAHGAAPFHKDAIELLSDAFFETGKDARSNGDLDTAMSRFEESLALQPGRADALGARVQVAVEMGRLDEAELALPAFLEATGGRPEILLFYGDILFRNGKVSAAREKWESALLLTGKNARDVELQRRIRARLDQTASQVED